MEGPSLFLASEQLASFKGKKVKVASGNTKLDKDRLAGKKVEDIFSWGKHLVFQFDTFAMRIHFLLFGTFEATVDGKAVTGDYKRSYEERLGLIFSNGEIKMFNCSIKFLETADAKSTYDFSIDIMSEAWDSAKAIQQMKEYPKEQIADILLDQEIFAGVGNMIKNEVLSLTFLNPKTQIKDIADDTLIELIKVTKDFSLQFYNWRKKFVLLKHLKIHRKGTCPHCGAKVVREKTGKKNRWSYYCSVCQPIKN